LYKSIDLYLTVNYTFLQKYRDEHFDTDLKNAYELGKRLVKKAEQQE